MKKEFGVEAAAAQEIYDASVGARVVDRAGNNMCGKGIAHEIMYCDKFNANPQNIIAGKHAHLTESVTAIRDDVVVMQDGRVVQRMQLKDTAGSINKTIQQTSAHKYAGTNLKGTQETAAVYTQKTAGRELQKMSSTGISSKDTERIANKALGKTVSLEGVLAGAKNSGKVGGLLSGGMTAAEMILDDEEYSVEEILEETAKSAVTGGLSGGAGFIGGELALTLIPPSVSAPVLPFAVGATGVFLTGKIIARMAPPLVDGIADSIRYGDLDYVADGMMEGVDTVLNDAVDVISDVVDEVEEVLSDAIDTVSDVADGVGEILSDAFDMISDVADGVNEISSDAIDAIDDAVDCVSDVVNVALEAFNDAVDVVTDLFYSIGDMFS